MDEFEDEPPADRIRRYRQLANQAEDDAIGLLDEELRLHFLAIAKNWRRLADEVEAREVRRRSS